MAAVIKPKEAVIMEKSSDSVSFGEALEATKRYGTSLFVGTRENGNQFLLLSSGKFPMGVPLDTYAAAKSGLSRKTGRVRQFSKVCLVLDPQPMPSTAYQRKKVPLYLEASGFIKRK